MKIRNFTLKAVFVIIGLSMISFQNTTAQTASVNLTVTPASCSGGGSVVGIVSVPGACSIDGFVPCTNASLSGPGQSGNTFNTCHNYQVGASNLAPGNYAYTFTALSPCSGTATFPFTIEQEGIYPDIETTNNPTDCNEDDFITVQNNSSATVNLSILDGPSLGSIAAGQSEDFTHESLDMPFSGDFTFTATTSSCPSPVEFSGNYPDGLPSPTSTVNTTNASSPSASDGSATVFVNNGFMPWTIIWSTGETVVGEIQSTIENLSPGNYSVEVIAGNGCSFTNPFEITDGTPTMVNDLAALFGSVKLFPNPASGNTVNLQVDAYKTQRVSIVVMNSLGQTVVPIRNFEIAQGTTVLNLNLDSDLTSGVYYLQIFAGDRVGSLPLLYSQE
ncbi:MAG TPA: T9SS type A sorting domain-containing protein [Cryomorphaceae bacterium]|nr:T9SS type A sorting domain-containing protein [Cryomorphaceae bacterium]